MRQLRSFAILLVAYQVASTAALDSLVLCSGMDGHIALEALVEEGSCDSAPPGTVVRLRLPTPAITDGGDGSHCGPCRDLGFGMGEAEQVRSRDWTADLHMLAAGAASTAHQDEMWLQAQYREPVHLPLSDHPSNTATHLRSTILLI